MRKLVLASHGSLAEGMQSAVRMILSDQEDMAAFGLDRCETPQNILAEVRALMEENPGDDFIVLCDIKGGSVHNQLLQLCESERVSLFTGMNLSLVLELCMPCPGTPWPQERQQVMEVAKGNIGCYDAQVLEEMRRQQQEEEDVLW